MRIPISVLLVAVIALGIGGCAYPSGYGSNYKIGSSEIVGPSQASSVLAERIALEGKSSSGEPLAEPVRLLEGSPPAMPPEAIDKRIEGTVRVSISFNEHGTVSKVAVVSSPSELLSAAVVEAVSRWRVEPRSSPFTAGQSFIFKVAQ